MPARDEHKTVSIEMDRDWPVPVSDEQKTVSIEMDRDWPVPVSDEQKTVSIELSHDWHVPISDEQKTASIEWTVTGMCLHVTSKRLPVSKQLCKWYTEQIWRRSCC